MTIPAPQYPSNPFTRIQYPPSILKNFFSRLKCLKESVNIGVAYFINAPYHKWFSLPIKKQTKLIRCYFQKYLRFSLLRETDSEKTFYGHWVKKNRVLSAFENLYHEWLYNPVQSFLYRSDNDRLEIERKWTATLKKSSSSEWSIINDFTKIEIL